MDVGLPVLPPVITDERDRRFLKELNDWITHEMSSSLPSTQEMSDIDTVNTQQCYVIYKQVLSKVTLSQQCYVTYKQVLSKVTLSQQCYVTYKQVLS